MRPIPPPRPASEHDMELDGRIRMKLNMGESLDDEERAHLSRMPGERETRYF